MKPQEDDGGGGDGECDGYHSVHSHAVSPASVTYTLGRGSAHFVGVCSTMAS